MNKIKTIVFLALFCILFWYVQKIFLPNWCYPGDGESHTSKVSEYKSLDTDAVQVLMCGTSHMTFGVDPMQLYTERSIRSYNLGLSGFRLSSGYFYIKNALKTQHPQVLLLDASALYLDYYREASWRFVLDAGFPMSSDSINAAVQYAKEYTAEQKRLKEEAEEEKLQKEQREAALKEHTADQKKTYVASDANSPAESNLDPGTGTQDTDNSENELPNIQERVQDACDFFNAELSVLVPLYNYHDRWASLKSYDFSEKGQYAYYGKGYVYSTLKGWAGSSLERINQVAENLSESALFAENIVLDGKIPKTIISENEVYCSEPDEEQLKWFYKIYDLCEKENVELVLTKIPVVATYKAYESSWTKLRSQSIHRIANELGIQFCDLLYDYNLNIKPSDFRDSGMHLNNYGAKKVTAFLGNYLQNICGIKGSAVRQYDAIVSLQKKLSIISELQSYSKWRDYLQYLRSHRTGRTIIMTMHGANNGIFTKEELDYLHGIGMASPFTNRFGEMSYVGIIRNGKSFYESSSMLPIETTLLLDEETEITIKSVGIPDTSGEGPQASIVINDQDYALGGQGLNIVILDNATHCVIDQLVFSKEAPDSDINCNRNTQKLDSDIRLYNNLLFDQYELLLDK